MGPGAPDAPIGSGENRQSSVELDETTWQDPKGDQMSTDQQPPTAVVLTGVGRYADPWHDFAGTSAQIVERLGELGVSARVSGTDEATFAFDDVSLLVVDAGGGSTPAPALAQGHARAAVLAFARAGRPVLATHAASNTFFETPEWAEVLGGRWVPGISMHPPLDTTVVRVVGADHPITAGLGDFEATDERYSYLETARDVTVLVTHAHDERDHPLVWARERAGARVVYDAFGHDPRAYSRPGRIELLRREVDWLLRRTG